VLWAANGVAVSTTSADQLVPQLISDGAGGVVIIWEDYRNAGSGGDVYAQRIAANGALLWTAGGVAVAQAANDQVNPLLTSDGAGGAIIIWEDYRNDATGRGEALEGNSNIYAQRVDASGAMLWSANGVAISQTATDQDYPQLINDGAGGALIVWEDNRSDSGATYQIWAQRIAPNGSRLFSNGVQVSLATGDKRKPQLMADGSEGAQGAFVVWEDYRADGKTADIYAQRLAPNGSRVWSADTAVSTAVNDQLNPQLVSDNAGGAIVAWQDFRSGTIFDIYAQRINGNGTLSGVDSLTAEVPDGILNPTSGKTKPGIDDALRVLQIAVGQVTPTVNDLTHADVAPLGSDGKPKGDGKVDVYDAIGILRMSLGL
jgi:hypothetical protein